MAKQEYTRVLFPSGDAYKAMRCACCGGNAEAWQYVTAQDVVQRVVMCETNDLDTTAEDLGIVNSGCPFSFPPQTFYASTLREAVAWWNRINGLLVGKRTENALPEHAA